LAAACLLVAACRTSSHNASPTSTTAAPGNKSTSTTTKATIASCTLPLTKDTYDGFRIGIPAGWDLFTNDGTIVVEKDSTATEESTVTPVLITTGLTPTSVFQSSLESLRKEIVQSGGTMTSTVTTPSGHTPTATLALSTHGTPLTGQATLAVLPEKTAHGSSVAALLASWSPTSTFAGQRATLAAIGACYGPTPGTLYQVMKDQVFTYAIPLGWTVPNEGQDSIEIAQGDNASATYTLTLLPSGSGVNSPQSMETYAFGKLGVHVDHVLASVQTPSKATANGTFEGEIYQEFTGSLTNGQAVHGLVYVTADTGTSNPTGVIRLGLAKPDLWNGTNGALVHILDSIQHDFTQDLQQWESISRQQQAFSAQVQGFDYALNGVDLVHDQATGATFEAPYDTYTTDGPDGPGYYDDAGNKLQIQTP
jgi:hypothetical protein